MRISQAGIDLIKNHEGCKLTAYPDPGTRGDPWTIGYGHTRGVKQGMTITQAQAESFLLDDLDNFEQAIERLVEVDLTQAQFDALCSFVFNVGTGAFQSSTMLKLINAGNFDAAAQQFARWNKAGGRVLAGLVNRRQAEAELFMEA